MQFAQAQSRWVNSVL